MVAVGQTRFVVYGGVGCGSYSGTDCTRQCEALVLLQDLWEIDFLKAEANLFPLRQIDLSPALTGLIGLVAAPLPHTDHKIVTVGGGTANPFFLALLQTAAGFVPAASSETLSYRELEHRSRKASTFSLSAVSAIAAAAGAANDTHLMLFGGFVGNDLSSATFTIDLFSPSPASSFSRLNALTTGPDARSFPSLAKPDDQTLIMFGGKTLALNLGFEV
jgi:hypothetical protein